MSKIFIICPGDVMTGGPELLHQLAGLLGAEGRDASIVYLPFEEQFEVPASYRGYLPKVARRDQIVPGSIVVLPEIYWRMVGDFPGCRIYFWWLSVDNLLSIAETDRFRRLLPHPLLRRLALAMLRRHVSLHLCQSDYALRFAKSSRLEPAEILSDYIAPEYLEAIERPAANERENSVAYNPAKGWERTRLVLDRLSRLGPEAPRAVPLVGMSRAEVAQALAWAKVYVDFGDHPGKDRIPREAAALGTCVIVNRRGSAANARDVPIDEDYKIDDGEAGFAELAASRIMDICADYGRHRPRFDPYRRMIAAEPDRFRADVLRIFPAAAR